MVAPVTIEVLFESTSSFLATVWGCSKPFPHSHVFELPSSLAFQFLAADLTSTLRRKSRSPSSLHQNIP